MLLPLLAALSAIPGQAVYLEVPGALELEAVAIEFKGQKLALASSNDGWFGLIGVDLDVAPGLYPVTVSSVPPLIESLLMRHTATHRPNLIGRAYFLFQ